MMPTLSAFIVTTLLVLTNLAIAGPQGGLEANKKGGVHPIKAFQHLSQILGLTEYDDKSPVHLENKGLKSYIDILSTQPEFNKMAYNFYRQIDLLDREFEMSPLGQLKETDSFQYPMKRDAFITAVAGDASYPTIYPGWLWDLALDYAKGNPNTAMQLIGLCGNDDMAGNVPENYDYRDGIKSWGCPGAESLIFAPKSLGIDVDISDVLKSKVIDLQAPSKGGRYLNAKQYQIYASAFIACEVIQKGMPKSLVSSISKTIAWTYRTVTMRDYFRHASEYANQIVARKYGEFLKAYKNVDSKPLGKIFDEDFIDHLLITSPELIDEISSVVSHVSTRRKPTRKMFEIALSRLDAFSLLKNLYPDMFGAPFVFGEKDVNKLKRPHNWSEKRFDTAIEKMKSVIVDWESLLSGLIIKKA